MTILAAVAGALLGGILACFGTYYGCVLIDLLRGASGGDGIVTVGCLFLIVTVPLGAIVGGYVGVVLMR
jgi:hypothetical protein